MIYKKAYICSPLSAPSWELVEQNMLKAQQYMRKVSAKLSCSAVAPHAYLPNLLDDNIPKERELALSFGLRLLELCDCLVICGDRISQGMQGEINKALELGLDILQYDGQKLYRSGICEIMITLK